MAVGALTLPINIPWKLIAVSEDMIDTNFCDKRFPLEWRSSLAISAFEPELEGLPESSCEEAITYLKVTATITGYQPTRSETETAYASFPDVLADPDRLPEFERIVRAYWACYGVLLNVAVFPHPTTRLESTDERIDFAELGVASPFQNPFPAERPTVTIVLNGVNQIQNRLVDRFPAGGDGKDEFDLPADLEITFQQSQDRSIAAVEATVVYFDAPFPVRMTAFRGDQEVGVQTAGPELGQEHRLRIEAEGIDRVIVHHGNSDHVASLLAFGCVSVRSVPVKLREYPHVVAFEPKVRDLYQAATESGELLTASVSSIKTDKSFTNTEYSETGLSLQGTVGQAASPVGGFFASATGGVTHKWGETSGDSQSTQTDASRERRETQATTTNLTQMYNVLTGYHAGTNRAVFLMLPRPHVLQPTDHRTFIQGLRIIEGVQEFFLVVVRPKYIEGLSVEALLETGHFPENLTVVEPEVEYDRRFESFAVTTRSGEEEDAVVEASPTSTFTIESGWVIDRRNPASDAFHEGLRFMGGTDNQGFFPPEDDAINDRLQIFNYQPISDSTVQVSGRLRPLVDGAIPRHVELRFRVHTRSERPKPTTDQSSVLIDCLLITSRQLCASFKSAPCIEAVTRQASRPGFVVEERCLEMAPSLLTRDETARTRLTTVRSTTFPDGPTTTEVAPTLLTHDAGTRTRLPAMKELLGKVQSALTNSGRLSTRLPFGEVGFLDTDYFKNHMVPLLPSVPQIQLTDVPGLPAVIIQAFGEAATVGDALKLTLSAFAAKTGLPIRDAADARFLLLTAKVIVP